MLSIDFCGFEDFAVEFIDFFNEEYSLFSSGDYFGVMEYETENSLSPNSSNSNRGFSLS